MSAQESGGRGPILHESGVLGRNVRSLLARAKAGIPSFGLAVLYPCPSIVELAVLAGYDFIRIDCEHTMLDAGELRSLLQTCRLLHMPCQVRVTDLASILPLLGQEPTGIMVPHVESVAEARQAIDACKFAPVGRRGMDGNTRRMRCEGMSREAYMQYAMEYQDLTVQIESRSAIERIDDILSMEGIDLVATGRADLSQEFGVPGQKNHPDVAAAEDFIIRKALEHGKYPIITAGSPKRVKELYDMGVRCFVVGKDEALLAKAMKTNLKDMKGEC